MIESCGIERILGKCLLSVCGDENSGVSKTLCKTEVPTHRFGGGGGGGNEGIASKPILTNISLTNRE